MLMGVAYDRVDKAFEADLEVADRVHAGRRRPLFAGRKWPRIGIYEPWEPNSDTGWTQWVFDRLQIPYTVVRSADFRRATWRSASTTIVFASQSTGSILHGYRAGENTSRPEYPVGRYAGSTAAGIHRRNRSRRTPPLWTNSSEAAGGWSPLDDATDLPV